MSSVPLGTASADSTSLLSLIESQRVALLRQNEILDGLNETKASLFTVIDVDEAYHPLLTQSFAIVRGINLLRLSLMPGDSVLCDEEGHILKTVPHPGTGTICTVRRSLS